MKKENKDYSSEKNTIGTTRASEIEVGKEYKLGLSMTNLKQGETVSIESNEDHGGQRRIVLSSNNTKEVVVLDKNDNLPIA